MKQVVVITVAVTAILAAAADVAMQAAKPKETVTPASKLVKKGVFLHMRR